MSAYYDLALVCRSLQRTEQAATCLATFQALKKARHMPLAEEKMVDDLPQTLAQLARHYYNAYAIYRDARQATQGLPLLQRAIALDPGRTYYLEMLGVYFSNQQQFARAISVYRKAQTIDPNKPLFGVNIGKLYRQMDQPVQAERMFTQTINDFPQSAVAYAELIHLYLGIGKHVEKTVGLAQRAVALQPSDKHYYLLAVAHQANGQYPPATHAVQQAIERAPANKDYRMLYELLKTKSPQ